MSGVERILELRNAQLSDLDFAFETWSVAIKPFIEPHLEKKQSRNWDDEVEKRLFSNWWHPEPAEIMVLDGENAGWLAAIESDGIVNLTNFVVATQYRTLGVATKILEAKLKQWSRCERVDHSVLIGADLTGFFERFGFSIMSQDDMVINMRKILS